MFTRAQLFSLALAFIMVAALASTSFARPGTRHSATKPSARPTVPNKVKAPTRRAPSTARARPAAGKRVQVRGKTRPKRGARSTRPTRPKASAASKSRPKAGPARSRPSVNTKMAKRAPSTVRPDVQRAPAGRRAPASPKFARGKGAPAKSKSRRFEAADRRTRK